jgi:hypothetical protein
MRTKMRPPLRRRSLALPMPPSPSCADQGVSGRFALLPRMDFGDSLLVECIGGLATGLILTALVGWRDAVQRTAANDATVADLHQDTSRFLRDRNRLLAAEVVGEWEEAARVNMQESVDYAGRLSALKRRALHEYRDEITGKRRRYRDSYRTEGFIDVVVRHYRDTALARYALTDSDRETLREWRAPVEYGDRGKSVEVNDPTAGDADLARFEASGDPGEHVRSVELREQN